ncbi:acyl-CoA dehydrogenase family protein [Albimonas sp. CAU 1670]|uniref:acyl-CoA dehydrogenase family protein n=1 Tax=Albimonas sp. CAU 1670 TaxID=3032599 RepID=UPI0023DA4D82|nr:acyl-CoA dehydrogenase family protein [Albimonas sp. CAU 1670]MDF2231296.1 acyl-CoA dehydrogenase family protein [Albimonas sp. CAU 1670]
MAQSMAQAAGEAARDEAPRDEAAFRAEVARFIADNIPPEMAARNRVAVHPGREDYLGWARILARRGWSAPGWPKEHGGAGWTARQLQVLEEESFRAGAPSLHIQTVDLAGPLIAAFGTEAQKAKYLPAIREGRELWAQGFSEPGSGSDLASLSTRAVRDGDHYVVTGQKIWTSDAYYCDRIFCLVRTSTEGRPQQGITMLLFPLDLPGVTVRPIPLIDGGHSLCEVFFDGVRVPVEDRLGEEGGGWTCAKHLLAGERVRTAEAPRNAREIARLRAILEGPGPDGRPLLADPLRRARLAELEMDLAALRVGVEMELDGRGAPGLPTPSVLKLQGTELMQAAQRFSREALGPYGAIFHDLGDPAAPMAEPGPEAGRGAAAESLFRRAATIYGGSSEVQKGIIAKAIEGADAGAARPPAEGDLGLLRDSLDGVLARHGSREARRVRAGVPAREGLWPTLAAQGWLGAGLPEAAGGFGGGARESAEIAEAVGRALLGEPLGPVVAAARALAFLDPAGQAARLEAVVAGELLPVLVHDAPGGAASVSARRTGDGWRLSGRVRAALGAPEADLLAVPARLEDGGEGLFLVAPEAARLHACRTLDDRAAAEAVFEDAPALERVEGAAGALALAIDHALVDACADALGAMDRAFWLARDHVAQRRQFGQALIRFQAIQHRLAEMLVEIQRARAMLEHGIEALGGVDPAARARAMSRMKARVDRSAFFVGAQAIQLHGGMGLTEDCEVGGCFKRICVQGAMMGTADDHLARLVRELDPDHAPPGGADAPTIPSRREETAS